MLEQFRDVMIIIMAFISIGATVLFIVLTIVVFSKISHTLNSVKALVSDIRGVSSLLSDSVVKPTIKGISFAAGARKVLVTLSKRAHSKEEKGGK